MKKELDHIRRRRSVPTFDSSPLAGEGFNGLPEAAGFHNKPRNKGAIRQ